jgi:hypothetical protein
LTNLNLSKSIGLPCFYFNLPSGGGSGAAAAGIYIAAATAIEGDLHRGDRRHGDVGRQRAAVARRRLRHKELWPRRVHLFLLEYLMVS